MLDVVPDDCLVAVIFTTQSSSSPFIFPYHLVYCCFLLVYFLFQLLYSSPLFSCSLCFLFVKKNSDFSLSLCIHFLPNSFPHLYDPTVNFFSGRLPVSSSLSSSFGVLSFSFIWNIFLWCLILSMLVFVFLCVWQLCYLSGL